MGEDKIGQSVIVKRIALTQQQPPKSVPSKAAGEVPERSPTDVVSFPSLAGFSSAQIKRLSPAALAYIGDAVYELYIRTRYLLPPKRISDYHQQVVECVRAESQAEQLQLLQPYLNENEREILRRGRNAVNRCPQRLSPDIYQQATSLETLVGHLYLTDPQRLQQLLERLDDLHLDPR
jgi:ribonuclease-3 family protein